MPSEFPGGAPSKGGIGQRMCSLKNTPAAATMVFLAAGGTPGGGGKGRGVRLVGILIGLNLAMCRTQSLHIEVPMRGRNDSSADECGS